MYTCERCGTGFGRRGATSDSCPRCLAREGVRVTLVLRALAEPGPRAAGPRLEPGLAAAVRRGLASGAR